MLGDELSKTLVTAILEDSLAHHDLRIGSMVMRKGILRVRVLIQYDCVRYGLLK
jgi:hypothetical protein